MDPSSSYWLEIALYILFWLMTAFAAAGETVITALNRIRVQTTMDRGATRAEAFKGILGDARRSLATVLVLNTIGLVGGAASATLLALATAPVPNQYLTALSLVLILLLGQFVPKALAVRSPERAAAVVARPLDIMAMVFSPLVRLVGFLATGSADRATDMLAREEEFRMLVDVGEEEGIIEEEEREMIEGVFDLGDTVAREVMVPRIDIVAIEAHTSLRDALDLVIECGHSRLPVYEETIDQVIGLLYAKDLLRYLRDGNIERTARDIMRKAYFIPESKAVDVLLSEMKRMKVHIALIVDEYGGTAGLVTIEDLIEEIVGEIQDEYDVEEPISETISAQETIYDARVDLDDVNYELDLDLPTDGSDTLGGLIYSRLGRVPEVGDEVVIDTVRLTVLTMDGRRIGRVKLVNERPLPSNDDSDAPGDGETAPQDAPTTKPANGETWDNTRRANGTA